MPYSSDDRPGWEVDPPAAGTKPTNPKDAIGSTKLPFHVLPLRVLAGVVHAFLGGALKYGSHNYRKAGVRASVYIDGALRHILRFAEGEDFDPDVIGYDAEEPSKGVLIHHIDEAIAGLMVLRDSMLRGNWTDDRAPFSHPGWIDGANAMSALIIARNPNPVMPVTEASVRASSAPASPLQADTVDEPTPPVPFVAIHDTEPGPLFPEPVVLEALPEGFYWCPEYSTFYRKTADPYTEDSVYVEADGWPVEGAAPNDTIPFWTKWQPRRSEFPKVSPDKVKSGAEVPVTDPFRDDSVLLEAIPEGITRRGGMYDLETFFRGDICVDHEGSSGDVNDSSAFWSRWKDRWAEFPLA